MNPPLAQYHVVTFRAVDVCAAVEPIVSAFLVHRAPTRKVDYFFPLLKNVRAARTLLQKSLVVKVNLEIIFHLVLLQVFP